MEAVRLVSVKGPTRGRFLPAMIGRNAHCDIRIRNDGDEIPIAFLSVRVEKVGEIPMESLRYGPPRVYEDSRIFKPLGRREQEIRLEIPSQAIIEEGVYWMKLSLKVPKGNAIIESVPIACYEKSFGVHAWSDIAPWITAVSTLLTAIFMVLHFVL